MEAPTTRLPRQDRQTGYSFIFGIILWFLYLSIIYGLTSVSCVWGWFSFKIAGIPGLQFVRVLLGFGSIGLMLVLIYLPWRDWRGYQTEKPKDNPHLLQDTEKDRRPLVAFVTMLLNSLFLLFIIALFVPMFALRVCSQA